MIRKVKNKYKTKEIKEKLKKEKVKKKKEEKKTAPNGDTVGFRPTGVQQHLVKIPCKQSSVRALNFIATMELERNPVKSEWTSIT